MTDRARLISAFITPFGLFEWNRMPFGLKNAPQIYQRMIDNALYGFTRIPKSEDHGIIADVFEDREPVDPGRPSVLGRRSYIDDSLIPANSWDQLCDRVEGLLEACDEWNLSISVVKSFWGMPKVEYLGHKVSHSGLETNPKILSALTDLAFPGSLRAMQSFLGSLNYYSRFIEDYAIYASVLYEDQIIPADSESVDLSLSDFLRSGSIIVTADPGITVVPLHPVISCLQFLGFYFTTATTPILRHFDPDRKATVVVYASDWAISEALMEEYDQIYYPVTFASRTLKSNELNYGIAEKEIPGSQLQYVGRTSDPCVNPTLNIGVALQIHGLTRTFRTMGGSVVGHLRSPTSITPRSEVDKALISIAPKKEPRRKIQAPIPTIGRDEELYVVSFDGLARAKRGGGAYSAI
ncbi:reverse transcriptase, partial [Phytophthora megakarya]